MHRAALGLVLFATAASADDRPAAPGNPPRLDHVPKQIVIVAPINGVHEMQVDITDQNMTLTSAAATVKLVLPRLAKGTFRGKTATLSLDKKKRTGAWIVELTDASPGYLKMPGICKGRFAATFTKDIYIVGGFEAACWTLHNPTDKHR